MGFALRIGDAAAAWIRRAGAGTLERAHRKISATRGRRQYSDLPAVDGRAIFSHVAKASAPSVAQAADRVHAEEHAAASRCQLADPGFCRATVFTIDTGSRSAGCEANSDRQRQGWPRIARRTQTPQ